jgi:hypothetical protein
MVPTGQAGEAEQAEHTDAGCHHQRVAREPGEVRTMASQMNKPASRATKA